MAHALGVQRLDLYLQFDRPLDESELDTIRELIRRRGAREPVAYLVGEREFYSLPFLVDARVLVPRPETEHLVEVAVAALGSAEAPLFCDVGTGSGCVLVAVAHELPQARGIGIDLDAGALEVARTNAEKNQVLERVEFLEGDLLGPLTGHAASGHLDAVLSNPPYIVRGDPSLEAGVRTHEPDLALYVPAQDALDFVRRLAEAAAQVLKPGGLLAIEVGQGGAPGAQEILAAHGYTDLSVKPDLAGIDRIVSAVHPS